MPTLVQHVISLFDDELIGMAPGSQRAYRRAAAYVGEFLGPATHTDTLTAAHFIALVKDLVKREYSPSTANLYIVVINKLLGLMLREDLLDTAHFTPADQLKVTKAVHDMRPRRRVKYPEVPTADEVARVIAAAYASERPAPLRQRDIALVEVLAATGMRIQEVSDLRVGQIHLDDGTALITGKGRKQRTVYFSPAALKALRDYWAARRNNARTAPALAQHGDSAGPALQPISPAGLRLVISELKVAAGVQSFTPHKFRHVFATRLLEDTGDIATVREALGHTSIETTMIYAHVNQKKVRQAVQALHRH